MPRTPSVASPARSRSRGSRTAQECGSDIAGTYTHRPFRLEIRCQALSAYDSSCRILILLKATNSPPGKTWNSLVFGVTTDSPVVNPATGLTSRRVFAKDCGPEGTIYQGNAKPMAQKNSARQCAR